MDNIFGLPMGHLAVALVALLGLLFVPVLATILFKRVMFRIGIRNLPRRRAQTALIVFGLMLSTLIMSSALGVGDSLNYSIKKGVYDGLGPIDETVAIVDAAGAGARIPFPEGAYGQVAARLAGDGTIDGHLPSLTGRAAVQFGGRSEPAVQIMGLPADQTLQALRAPNGTTLAGLRPGEVLINARLAADLGVAAGDTVRVDAGPVPLQVRVAGILPDGGLAGTGPQVTAPLPVVQAAIGLPGQLTAILVSNRGGVEDGAAGTDAAMAALQAAVAGTPLAPEPVKRDGVARAARTASTFTTVFLVFGLFSVTVGVLLIFLIFVMLAAERRPELGISRAIGTQRRHLIQAFLAEGAAYALLAAAVGAGLGVLVAWVLIVRLGNLLAGIAGGWAFGFAIAPRSLLVAYCLGMIVTFLTVLFSAWRVSRLNIVAAIRDLPDLPVTRVRSRATVLWGLATVGAVALAVAGWRTTGALAFWVGTSLAIGAAGAFARRLGVPARPAYSTAGLGLLLVWLGRFFADDHSARLAALGGGLETYFLAGVMLVTGAVWVAMHNAGGVAAGVAALTRRSATLAPVLRTAFAYPLASPFRTGLTTAMFALVVFSLVLLSVFTAAFTLDAAGIDRWAGGYLVRATANPNNAPRDLAATLAGDPALRGTVAGGGTVAVSPAEGRQEGSERPFGAVPLKGGDPYFLAHARYTFKVRADGYADDRAIWEALARDPALAVVTATTVPTGQGTDAGAPFLLEGVTLKDTALRPIAVTLRGPGGGEGAAYRVIGVLDDNNLGPAAVYTSAAGLARVAGAGVAPSQYSFTLVPGADAVAAARALEVAFAGNGLQAKAQAQKYAEDNAILQGFMALLQAFMGLGLLVGIAALGVVAIRSVVERRQQIGVLRALGFTRGMVQLGLLLEFSFIAAMGIAIGASLGLILAYLLLHDPAFGGGGAVFNPPWRRLGATILAAYGAAALMTYLPARQAGRVPVAAALRCE